MGRSAKIKYVSGLVVVSRDRCLEQVCCEFWQEREREDAERYACGEAPDASAATRDVFGTDREEKLALFPNLRICF